MDKVAGHTGPLIIQIPDSISTTGEICKTLNPIEVAFFMGLSIPQVLSGLIASMVMEGYMEETSTESGYRKIKINASLNPEQMDEYETLFLKTAVVGDIISLEDLQPFITTASDNIKRKAMETDAEATKIYYNQHLKFYVDLQTFGSQSGNQLAEERCWHYWYHDRTTFYTKPYHWDRDPFRYVPPISSALASLAYAAEAPK